MEPAEAWGHWDFQSAKNWTFEEQPAAAAAAWAPAPGFPVEYAPIDIFGTTFSHQAYYVPPEYSGGLQLVGHYYYSSATQHDGRPSDNPGEASDGQQVVKGSSGKQQVVDIDPQDEETAKIVSNGTCATYVCKHVFGKFKADMDLIKQKMHRYPASLRSVDPDYKVPRVVALGPYHHHLENVQKAEEAKQAAAILCASQCGDLLQDLYSAVVSATDDARSLYDKDVMAGISCSDFRNMMFLDACFLVQYMIMWSGKKVDESLEGFMGPNRRDIRHDVMLLENQLPWTVVETVLTFMHLHLNRRGFASLLKDYLQDHKIPIEGDGDDDDDDDDDVSARTQDEYYEPPPHLLGLIRYYGVAGSSGGGGSGTKQARHSQDPKELSISISARELAEIGIVLTANKTTELSNMGLHQEGTLFTKLSMAPLALDHDRASYLVNMAALELCTVKMIYEKPEEASDVCSYIQLLATLVYRAEDVQELRAKGLLEGGGGLTNDQVLSFLSSLQGLHPGKRFLRIMKDIQIYKESRRVKTKLYAYVYNNKKIIATVVTGVVSVVGIIATLLSIKKSITHS